MLVSMIRSNSEAWHALKKSEIAELERADEYILRKITVIYLSFVVRGINVIHYYINTQKKQKILINN